MHAFSYVRKDGWLRTYVCVFMFIILTKKITLFFARLMCPFFMIRWGKLMPNLGQFTSEPAPYFAPILAKYPGLLVSWPRVPCRQQDSFFMAKWRRAFSFYVLQRFPRCREGPPIAHVISYGNVQVAYWAVA